MDDLHTLAVEAARRILESEAEDPDIRELARLLLEEARRYVKPRHSASPEPAGASS